jgi:hypothetical protein
VALEGAFDHDGKVAAAIATLAGLESARDAIVLDAQAGPPLQVADLMPGGDVTVVDRLSRVAAPASADALVALWTGFEAPSPEADLQLEAAGLILRAGGRLVVAQDYGRDDTSGLWDDEARGEALIARSRRDGWFLSNGFRVRVLHAWWEFGSHEEAVRRLEPAFGERAGRVLAEQARPRLEYKVALYHRVFDGPRPS